jgi:F420-dependent oxidoreductase-like protein
MRVCLMIEGQQGVSWEQWLDLAATTEGAGLEGLFRSDHYLSIGTDGRELGSHDAWTTLAGLAARTTHIRLGTMVSPATFRHPSVLAKSATAVDHISGGRVELGIGAGWYEEEHRVYGFPFPPMRERMEIFEEQIAIVHGQWSEGDLDFSGRHYRLERCAGLPKPVQRPRPPIIVGGAAGPRTVEAAVRFADEYNTTFANAEACRERRARIDAACERAGRDPASMVFSVMTTCLVGSDRGDLRARVERFLERGGGGDVDAFLRDHDDGWIVGTVEEAAEHLQGLAAAGVERVMLQHLVHEDLEMVEILGRELAPAVAGAEPARR